MNHSHAFSVFQSLKGKNLFITGATGFLGKVLVEKLLREVPELGKIYILVRAGNKDQARQRLYDELLNVELFDSLKAIYGKEFESYISARLIPVPGSLTEHRFGLSADKFSCLAQNTDLIVNGAASVNFRESVDQALEINTLSLHNIASLAREGANSGRILPVVHISTCYVNGYHEGTIKEEIKGPARGGLKQLTEHTYQISPVLDQLHREIAQIKELPVTERQKRNQLTELGVETARRYGWNDTYTFTKWLGEQVLLQDLKPQNITILRPSIIESAAFLPRPGWIEGVKVADAMIYAYARKRLTVIPGHDKGILDIIPVDLVANAAIIALAERAGNGRGVKVYQCCSGKSNPISIHKFAKLLQQEMQENYCQYPNLLKEKPAAKFRIVPVGVLELYLRGLTRLVNARELMAKLIHRRGKNSLARKLATTTELAMIYGFYTAPKYCFDSSRMESLATRVPESEQQQFTVRSDSFDWQHYVQQIHLPGLNRYAVGGVETRFKVASVDETKVEYKVA